MRAMKPLIGITTGEIVNPVEPWAPLPYGQKRTYSDAIIAAGGIPVLIPFMPEAELKNLYLRLDGILFAGGNDLNPELYGEDTHPLTVKVSPARDRVETMLMGWALADNKPLFAICRGFQLLNVHLGGSLYQDLSLQLTGVSDHELSLHEEDYTLIAHHLKVLPESLLSKLINSTEIDANSRHHQGIKVQAESLRAVAWSEDGVVEALEHPNKSFVLGVQCHPESLYQSDEKWASVFQAFIKSSSAPFVPRSLFRLRRKPKENRKTKIVS
jgi:putative glutamine amidotransferase